MNGKCIGVVGIVISDLEKASDVNAALHLYSDIIVGRIGIPYRERGVSVISLIVDGDTASITSMTNALEQIESVTVKSSLIKA